MLNHTQSVPLTPCLRVHCNLIIIRVEWVILFLSPIYEFMVQNCSSVARFMKLLQAPVQSNALSTLDLLASSKYDFRSEQIQCSHLIFHTVLVKETPGGTSSTCLSETFVILDDFTHGIPLTAGMSFHLGSCEEFILGVICVIGLGGST